MQQQTVSALIGALEQRFNLHWVAGKCSAKRDISKDISWGSHPKVIGHLNLIHPNHIQVIGQIEMRYLDNLPPVERNTTLSRIFSGQTFAIIIAESLPVPAEFQLLADQQSIALLSCKLPSNELVTELRYVLTGMLAEKQTMHGVFMEVTSVGILLTGDSSIGKSELALELITRGHRLIADDAPEFARITPDIVSGSSPPMLHDLLEVRGLGVLNIREMYGDGAIKHSKYLRLIINLVPVEQYNHPDRISSDSATREVLGVNISEITLPVAPGRNLAVMVEAAVLSYLLKSRGYDAGSELIRRQEQLMTRGN
ncbi:MAG TPA: HPr(Ser) kinase/phosphatase [Gammaproteobacteria bacterium]|jgi:HPr kinase/phosphorylase